LALRFSKRAIGRLFAFGSPFVGSIGGPLLQYLDLGRAWFDAPVDPPRYDVQPKLSYRPA
jgi:hypothetical protein